MKIKQHFPGYFDFEPQTVEFDSQEGLLAIPFVKRFAEQPDFHQFSLDHDHLMAECKNGTKWWVVGYIDNKEGLTLPKWDEVAAAMHKR